MAFSVDWTDGAELIGRHGRVALIFAFRLDRGDLALGLGDGGGHLDDVEADLVDRGGDTGGRLGFHGALEFLDGIEQHRGIRVAVSPGIFGQEPATP